MSVTLEWMGCATFRLTINKLVVFLDAYIDRVPSAEPIGISIDEIDRADWIVIGHSHFDHLYGAERIALATGAALIGSHETVRILESNNVPLGRLMPVAGGEKIRLSADVTVSVYPSLHSCLWAGPLGTRADEICLGDLGVTLQERVERMKKVISRAESANNEVRAHLAASDQRSRGDGGTLIYLFETPKGSLLFQDTSGYWSGILGSISADIAILAAAGRGNIDGEPIQGSLAQFLARQAELVRPKRLVLCHHDNWLPGFTKALDIAPIREEIARRLPKTELIETGYLEAYPIFKGL